MRWESLHIYLSVPVLAQNLPLLYFVSLAKQKAHKWSAIVVSKAYAKVYLAASTECFVFDWWTYIIVWKHYGVGMMVLPR